MKYKIGDRVRIKSLDWYNENKNEDGRVACGYHIFTKDMSKFCGCTMIVCNRTNLGVMTMGGSTSYWTDEMIEGLAEEEKKPEFKVGDKITNRKTQLTILQITSDKYIVEDSFGECGTLYFNTQDDWKLVEEETKPKFKVGDKVKDKNNRVWFIVQVSETFFSISSVPNASDGSDVSGYFVPMEDQDDYELVPQCFPNEIELNNMKRNACQKCVFAVYDDNPHCGLRGFRTSFNVERCSAENDTVPNGYELQEDGYFSWVNKKIYPKTYEECAEIIAELTGSDCNPKGCMGYMSVQLTALQKLLICRDAYWKLCGEEMGLGKAWEPDYDSGVNKYGIICMNGVVQKSNPTTNWERHLNKVLDFPTAEMRDAFYEYFKEEIEKCKELL